MSKPHKHAALMLQYAQDAAEIEKPWERWEFQSHTNTWQGLETHGPLWSVDINYRRKPRTININGFEVPEPMRENPEYGSRYFTTGLVNIGNYTWQSDRYDYEWLRLGICHITREAAELHATALLSFTKKEETK